MQLCESWSTLERELQTIVTDSAMPRTIKKSCAWSALALAVGLAEKQEREHRKKVKMMQDQLDEQKLLINALLGVVQKQRDKQDEKGIAEFHLQQGLGDLNRVEGEQKFPPSNPVSVVRTQYQNQQGKKEDEDQETETHPLDSAMLGGDEGHDSTQREPLKVSGQDAAAATADVVVAVAAATVTSVEENKFSVRANRNEVDSSYPEMQKVWSQTRPLTLLSLSSSSVQPRFVSQVAAAAIEQTAIVPPEHCSRASWRGRQYLSGKILPEKFKPRFSLSQYKQRSIVHRAGDWYCDKCNVMNFSWRNICFRCKQLQTTKATENFLYNWRFL
ncbi:testis-expressed protein 13A-like [Peromyscus eremicus]|uniref:testis-expressed protein 13A-like n=1 Tax=Peromyscus eremicus TaxID=42410 RepID=UPI0027DC8C96|nr:testis-expressed protein 13A-like [Peromyscus eremicus]